ncbi:MAG: FecR family protein [Candidatus Delongbacteria bacterium]|nr:FecR family protein [Candidatus Delongbacteria bacterium]MCG2760104.1 FecR family protein [Candidatus Delongbacteria bacterium]
MRKKIMRYISITIILIAFAMQVSCKSNDETGTVEINKEAIQQTVKTAQAVEEDVKQPGAEKIAETVTDEIKKVQTPVQTIKDTPKKTDEPKVIKTERKTTDEKGIVSYIEGNVKKKSIEESDYKTSVSEKTAVKSRESYKTMVKSRAELELSGLDILRLAPKTTIDLVALYEETKDGKQKTDIKLEEGDLWAQVNSSDEKSEFMMNTDIAAAAITGTNFRMSKTDELTEMKVYHGEVKISNAKEKMNEIDAKSVKDFKEPKQTLGPKQIPGPKQVSLEDWVYIVKNMQQITFDKAGKVVSAGEFKASDETEKTDWVDWNKKRDRQKGLK